VGAGGHDLSARPHKEEAAAPLSAPRASLLRRMADAEAAASTIWSQLKQDLQNADLIHAYCRHLRRCHTLQSHLLRWEGGTP
jgi:hypothetical protein